MEHWIASSLTLLAMTALAQRPGSRSSRRVSRASTSWLMCSRLRLCRFIRTSVGSRGGNSCRSPGVLRWRGSILVDKASVQAAVDDVPDLAQPPDVEIVTNVGDERPEQVRVVHRTLSS